MDNATTPRPGVMRATPQGGPIHQGTPVAEPGAGTVRLTPEGGPLPQPDAARAELRPPTWHENMKGPILGMPPPGAATPPPSEPPRQAAAAPPQQAAPLPTAHSVTPEDEAELKQWPPYIGKPVSDVSEAMRFAAPLAAQAESLAIRTLRVSGRGLSRLAQFLEERRQLRGGSDHGSRTSS